MRGIRRKRMRAGLGWAVVVALGLLPASGTSARPVIVLPRPGQIGFGGSGLIGTLAQSGDVGQVFNFGMPPGLAFRLRYRMRYERGFGVTFETHGFDPRTAGPWRDLVETDSVYAANSPFAAKRLNLFLYGVDFYQFFGTRTKTTRMLSVGAGIAHAVVALNDGEQQFPWGDAPYVSAGAGFERFFWQSWAWEAGVRYQAIFLGGKANHDLQASLGVIFYTSL